MLTTEEINFLGRVNSEAAEGRLVYDSAEIYANLIAGGLVQVNAALANEQGVAFAITNQGQAALQTIAEQQAAAQAPVPELPAAAPQLLPTEQPVPVQPAPAPVQAAPAAFETVPAVADTPAPQQAPTAEIQGYQTGGGFEAPAKQRRTVTKTKYPTDKLEIGQWFFIPKTVDNPNPHSRAAARVRADNKRYETFDPPRYFTSVKAVAGEKFGSAVAPTDGAFIARVAPPTSELPSG